MRIRVLSDLHLEYDDYTPPTADCDVVVLAGDIHSGDKAIAWAIAHFAPTPVVYVAGNHEHYRHVLPKHLDALRERSAHSNVRLLECDAVEVGGVVFLGCTLWTDFELFGIDPSSAKDFAANHMADFQKIRVVPHYRRLRPFDTIEFHQRSKRWLHTALALHAGRDIVVVTHHAPSIRSIPARLRSDLLSPAYASGLDDLIHATKPRAWIHGHVHESFDYTIGDTRIVCNPRGYIPREPNPNFDPQLVIDI